MKIFILISGIFIGCTTFVQAQVKLNDLIGKSIYCIVATEKNNPEGDQTSLKDDNGYSYLFKIIFLEKGAFSFVNKYKDYTARGRFSVVGKKIELVSDTKIKTVYIVTFYDGKYITLLSGNTTSYCIIN